MSVFHRIDSWLIEGPYQAVVDFSQRQPAWWGRQCAIGYLVMTCVHIAVRHGDQAWLDYVILAAALLAAPMQWLVTLLPAWFASMGESRFLRLSILAIALPDLLGLFGQNPAAWASDLLCHVAAVSYCYFAACKPPRPRVPRTRLAPGGAA